LGADNDDNVSQYWNIDNILGVASPPGLAMRQIAITLHL
jgi:hypothetical protein